MITVLVVGAGPTGLTLACDLARRGVSVRIIDRVPEFQTGSRGKGLQPRSLEVFDDLGVVDEILASGNSNLMFRHYVRERVIREVDPRPGVSPTSDVPYPRGLFIPQWRVEQVLRARLAGLGVRVELGSELVELTQTEGAVTATVVKDGGSERTQVDYLVACDGGKSRVRKMIGARFDGATYDTQQLLCGDVEVEGLPPDAWHQWFTDGQLVMLCPLPGTDAWQFQATPIDDKGPSLKTFQRIVDARTGMAIRLRNPTWLSTYRINVRMVDRLRAGRVFLAGDAAHVHPIAGGLGMNTGIQDAYNLGWKLATGSSELLDTYQEERLPIAAWTLETSSVAGKRVASGVRTGRGGVELVISNGIGQLDLNYRFSTLSRDLIDRTDRLRAGDRAPDAPLRTVESGPGRLFDAFRGPRFTLLGFGAGCAGALRELAGWVPTHGVTDNAEAYSSYDIGPQQDTLVLVRPDGYVGLTAAGDNAGGVRDYLATLTG